MDPERPDVQKLHAVIQIYAHGTIRQIMAQNWVEWVHFLRTQFFAIYATALFLLGMWVWRAGIVQRLPEYKPILKRICAWCITIGLALSAYVATMKAVLPPAKFSLWGWFAAILYLPGSHILSAGYISGLALLFLNEKWRPKLMSFAAVGRTALTNYLLQSVICTLFFYHYTTGLYGQIGPAIGLAPTIILYGAQVAVSNWWLRRYRFGPMEWLWRGLTYGKFPAMAQKEELVMAEA
jgi:uncharacterized protein